MVKEFLISLNPEDLPLLLWVDEIARITRKEAPSAPPKFKLARRAIANILSVTPVPRAQIVGLLDVIGGFYLAANKAAELGVADKTEIEDALKLMSLAEKILDQVDPPKLVLVK